MRRILVVPNADQLGQRGFWLAAEACERNGQVAHGNTGHWHAMHQPLVHNTPWPSIHVSVIVDIGAHHRGGNHRMFWVVMVRQILLVLGMFVRGLGTVRVAQVYPMRRAEVLLLALVMVQLVLVQLVMLLVAVEPELVAGGVAALAQLLLVLVW